MEKCFEVIWIFQENFYNAQKRGKLCIFASESIFLIFSSNLFVWIFRHYKLDCFEFSKEILIKLKMV